MKHSTKGWPHRCDNTAQARPLPLPVPTAPVHVIPTNNQCHTVLSRVGSVLHNLLRVASGSRVSVRMFARGNVRLVGQFGVRTRPFCPAALCKRGRRRSKRRRSSSQAIPSWTQRGRPRCRRCNDPSRQAGRAMGIISSANNCAVAVHLRGRQIGNLISDDRLFSSRRLTLSRQKQ